MACGDGSGICAKQTPGSKYCQDIVRAGPWKVYFTGITGSCRLVTGYTSLFSQHSWGNAIDIFPNDSSIQYLTLYPLAQFLQDNWKKLGLYGLIFNHYSWKEDGSQVRLSSTAHQHKDHIHVSFRPYGKGTPSCWSSMTHLNVWGTNHGNVNVLGPLASEATGGVIVPDHPGVIEVPGAGSPENDPNVLPLRRGDESELVKTWQGKLNLWFPIVIPPLVTDGRFGSLTESRVKYAQVYFDLSPSGIIDEVLNTAMAGQPQPPPVDIPEIVPLPAYDVGFEGRYGRFFYPLKGKNDPTAERTNQTGLEDYLGNQSKDLQDQLDGVAKYLHLISGFNPQPVATSGLPGPRMVLASDAGVDHRALKNVLPDQHHSRYTDAEAVAAVGASGGGGVDSSLFLKLDASNDPVTGRLHVDAEMYAHEFIETAAVGGTVHNHDSKYLTKLEAAGFADHVIASAPPPNPKIGEVWIDPLAIPPGQRQFFIQDAEPIGVDIGDVWVAPNA